MPAPEVTVEALTPAPVAPAVVQVEHAEVNVESEQEVKE